MSINPTDHSEFLRKKLEKHIQNINDQAMAVIDIISEVGINEMNSRGIPMENADQFNPSVVALCAAEKLGMDTGKLIQEYLILLEHEEMIVR